MKQGQEDPGDRIALAGKEWSALGRYGAGRFGPPSHAEEKERVNAARLRVQKTTSINFVGYYDCSITGMSPSARKNDALVVTNAGFFGGSGGPRLAPGDICICIEDTVGGWYESAGPCWRVVRYGELTSLVQSGQVTVTPSLTFQGNFNPAISSKFPAGKTGDAYRIVETGRLPDGQVGLKDELLICRNDCDVSDSMGENWFLYSLSSNKTPLEQVPVAKKPTTAEEMWVKPEGYRGTIMGDVEKLPPAQEGDFFCIMTDGELFGHEQVKAGGVVELRSGVWQVFSSEVEFRENRLKRKPRTENKQAKPTKPFRFELNEIVQHYKGGIYEITGLPDQYSSADTGLPCYAYRTLTFADGSPHHWIRSQAEMEDGRFVSVKKP